MKHPGGILGGGVRARPRSRSSSWPCRFYDLVHTLVSHDVPTSFLLCSPEFPPGVSRIPYLALKSLLQAHGVSHDEASDAFARVVRPDLIHTFGNGASLFFPPPRRASKPRVAASLPIAESALSRWAAFGRGQQKRRLGFSHATPPGGLFQLSPGCVSLRGN